MDEERFSVPGGGSAHGGRRRPDLPGHSSRRDHHRRRRPRRGPGEHIRSRALGHPADLTSWSPTVMGARAAPSGRWLPGRRRVAPADGRPARRTARTDHPRPRRGRRRGHGHPEPPRRVQRFNPAMVDELAAAWRWARPATTSGASCSPAPGRRRSARASTGAVVEEFAFDAFTYEDPGKLIAPEEPGPLEAGDRRGQRHGLRRGLLPAGRGRRDPRRRARHLLRPARHLRHGGRLRAHPAASPHALRRRAAHGPDRRARAGQRGDRPRDGAGERGHHRTRTCPRSAQRLAATIAAAPTLAVQATLRTLWAAKDLPIGQATELGNVFLQLGTSIDALNEGQEAFQSGGRIEPRVR